MNCYGAVTRSRIKNALIVATLVSAFGFASAVAAADVEGAKDHPIVSRYEGSEAVNYNTDTFNEFALFSDQVKASGGVDKNSASITMLEGRVTTLTYRNPPERTTLEVFRNYETALADAGFEELFKCSNADCGGRNFSHAVTHKNNYLRLGESYRDQRYLAAMLSRDGGDVYVSLFVAMASVGGGADFKRAITQLDVIEVERMQGNMVIVDADAMAKGIAEDGSIALYGILFDPDSATIKPESRTTLGQIAALFNSKPELDIVIVGHTDNKGSLVYNMELSERRAKAVEAALVKDFGIGQTRLSAWGVGYLSPVASNRNDAGRAKNRRVELVEN